MQVGKVQLFLCGVLLLGQAEALYGRKSAVRVLDSKNFDKVVLQQDVAAVVEFFAPWCGHCKNLAPTYEKVAKHLQGVATVGAVDCDADRNKPLCARYQVQGFPTLKVFPAVPWPSTSSNKRPSKSPTDYNGPRNAKSIAEAATDQIPSKYIKRIKGKADLVDPTPHTQGAGSAAPLALLFTDKATSTPLYRSLSVRFVGKIAFAEARSKDSAELVEEYGITSFPTLIVIPAEGEHVKYTGELVSLALARRGRGGDLKPTPLLEFLRGFAPGYADAAEATVDAASEEEEEKPKKAKKEPTIPDVVRNLTRADVASLTGLDDAFLIASFAGALKHSCVPLSW
ncbi:hypothetical protein WJX84_006756 [Apatococcus fuscideae]|uniref:Thioredoxin domain-containing protein n=1 Tax=Apatococcus fuscideae TaxID=2026836 RepID=A0AAW1SSJ5_9CHLO